MFNVIGGAMDNPFFLFGVCSICCCSPSPDLAGTRGNYTGLLSCIWTTINMNKNSDTALQLTALYLTLLQTLQFTKYLLQCGSTYNTVEVLIYHYHSYHSSIKCFHSFWIKKLLCNMTTKHINKNSNN